MQPEFNPQISPAPQHHAGTQPHAGVQALQAASALRREQPPRRPQAPRIRVVARPNPFGGNLVFWAVLDEVDPGNMLILTNGTRDWPARVLEVTDTIITARDNQRTYQFARRGPRAGHIAGH
ncbi:hypothetical protein ACJU26_05320 [Acidithiobacillus sp. M4-SHS-6]|uniref:hypothetical protein n=1 Tax=Acidithiobacillus sp. M4-SHS-6 TaxID=3383024 RepID=UPI0039BDA8B0